MLIFTIILSIYTVSYFCLRFSKMLVHQEVALVNKTGETKNERGVCCYIHQDVGHGSFVDEDSYNIIKPPGTVVKIGKCFYYPLAKLEILYWKLTRPRYIYETVCAE